MMSPTGEEHGGGVGEVAGQIWSFARTHKLGKVYGAETGFLISRDPDTVRAPDVAFLRAERVPPKPWRSFFRGAPDLVAEVLSPNDRASEVLDKVHQWLEAGCAVVWVVDPERQTVVVYESPDHAVTKTTGDELTCEKLLPGFRLPVAEIFAR